MSKHKQLELEESSTGSSSPDDSSASESFRMASVVVVNVPQYEYVNIPQ